MDVLLATDGYAPATAACRLLARLADPTKVEVRVVGVHDGAVETVDRYFDDWVIEAQQAMVEAGVAASSTWRHGEPVAAILRELAERPYGLVAVGAGNHSWLGRFVFGSVSNELLHRSPVPVLVVHQAAPGGDRLKVVVGADGSSGVNRAIGTLTSLADPDRVDVLVRSVVRIPTYAFAAFPGTGVPTGMTEDVEQARTIAAQSRDEAVERLRAAGFPASGSVGEGWPAGDLLQLAKDEAADLVLLGARREVGIVERATLGSVSSHVARHAAASLIARERVGSDDAWGSDEVTRRPNGHVDRNRRTNRWM